MVIMCCYRFYCEPCEHCVCVLCALHEHKEHEVSSLAAGLERHRGTFDALLDDCKTRVDAVRQQLTLVDAFKTSLNTAEDQVRHAAIDAIAAVRQRERELLEGLRAFVGDDALRFLEQRDALGLRLEELDNVRETTETMIGRTSVELLMTKKDVQERLRTALGRQQIQTPDTVRPGGVQYVAGAKPFHDLNRPTFNVAKLFRSVADDVAAPENHTTEKSSASSSSSSDSGTDSEDSDSEDEAGRHPKTVHVVCELPQLEHVDLVVRSKSDESETDSNDDDDDNSNDDDEKEKEDKKEPGTITKICISDGVVRRMVIKSQSLTDDTAPPPPTRSSGRKIPDFSRPPKPAATFVERGTETERRETTDAGTATPRVVVCDKETYTGYVCLVHKNVSTENQGTVEKGTSMVPDVTAVYRSLSNSGGGRSSTITRGTSTIKPMTCDRACSPIAMAPRTPSHPASAAAAKVTPGYPTNQKPLGGTTVQVPPTTQKSPTTSETISMTTALQIMPPTAAGKVQADPMQKTAAAGPANVALRMPQSTSPTIPSITPARPANTTTSVPTVSPQRQTAPVGTSTTQAAGPPSASKQPPFSSKLVMSSSSVSTSSPHSITATAPSQSVTSPQQVMTSSVVAVSTPPPQQKPPSASSAAMSSSVRMNAPTMTPPVTSLTSVVQVSKDFSLPSTAQAAASPPVSLTDTSLQSVGNNRRQSAVATTPIVNKQTAATAAGLVTPSITASTPAAGSVSMTSPAAAAQKPLTSEQRQPQPGSSRSPPAVAVLPRQSSLDTTAPPGAAAAQLVSAQMLASTTTAQKPVTSSVLSVSQQQQRTAGTPAMIQSQTQSTALASVNTTITHNLTTSSLSPSNTTSSVYVVTSPQSQQLQTTSATNTAITCSSVHISATAQKPATSSVSATTATVASAQVVTSQAALSSNLVSNTVPLPLVSTNTRNSVTPTTLYSMQTSASAQKPVTSLASATTQPRMQTVPPTATTTMMSQAATTSSFHIPSAATSMSPPASSAGRNSMTSSTPVAPTSMTTAQKPVTSSVSSTTTAQSTSQAPATSSNAVISGPQKLVTSQNGQLQTVTSPTAATVETLAAAAQQTAMTSHHGVLTSQQALMTSQQAVLTSPDSAQTTSSRVAALTTASSKPHSVFRSISMDNLRAPAPVLRPPPPIITTSVAAVTQRLNGGAGPAAVPGNGASSSSSSAKNGWKPSNNR